MPTYSELRFAPANQDSVKHTVYWHRSHVAGESVCGDCHINFVVRQSLMELVQAINPGQPELPDWVYNGAILGVQGGTDTMLGYLQEASESLLFKLKFVKVRTV